MQPRNAYCSFCRKSYREVGPLVEGPGDVYICAECVELCQQIIKQESRRRARSSQDCPDLPNLDEVQALLNFYVNEQADVTKTLSSLACRHYESLDQRRRNGDQAEHKAILLVGPTASSKVFLSRALAHVLKVPFASGDGQSVIQANSGLEGIPALLHRLLGAADFDVEAAERGIVYVDGVDQPTTRDALRKFWDGAPGELVDANRWQMVDVSRVLVICGGVFEGLDEIVARLGRHPEQTVFDDALIAFGVQPDFASRIQGIIRVSPLDEKTLVRLLPCVHMDQLATTD